MAGLYLGSSPVSLGGASRLCLGSEQVWPLMPSGPVFDPYTIHAWDPDGGSDGSGVIADAIGSAPLRPINGTAPIANWNGEFASNSVALFVDAPDISVFRGLAQATITFWVCFRAGTASFHGLVAHGDGITTAAAGSFQVYRDGAGQFKMEVKTSYVAADTESFAPGTDQWRMVTLTLGANNWRALFDGLAAEIDISWLGQAMGNVNRGLAFGAYAPVPVTYTGGVNGNNGFRGRYGDIRLHNKVLSPAEIGALFAAGRQTY